jgi:hypothetical protein
MICELLSKKPTSALAPQTMPAGCVVEFIAEGSKPKKREGQPTVFEG